MTKIKYPELTPDMAAFSGVDSVKFKRICNILKSNSFFLFGARGTGKLTFLKDTFEDPDSVLSIDLLNQQTQDKW